MTWANTNTFKPKQYSCGHCGDTGASEKGYYTTDNGIEGVQAFLFICPGCKKPTFFYRSVQLPGITPGNKVAYLPQEVESLYREARNAVAVGAPTAAVLACRKLLMNIAVAQGAQPGESFLSYVDYLAQAGYVPPNGRGWVDHIRTKGNEATHEIKLMSSADANELISFAEMLLKFIYEFPNKVPQKIT